jgi:hypothetical protein
VAGVTKRVCRISTRASLIKYVFAGQAILRVSVAVPAIAPRAVTRMTLRSCVLDRMPVATVTSVTASDDLLRRLESDEELAGLPMLLRDFDVKRRDPVEELGLANGLPLTPVAGDGAGGTYFLCGEQGEPDRPVLFADSEGRAVLMAASLVEAVELIVQFPYWHDLPYGRDPGELEAEYRDDDGDFDAARAETIAVLGLSPLTLEQALTRLRAAVARYEPGFVPACVTHDGGPYRHYFDHRKF